MIRTEPHFLLAAAKLILPTLACMLGTVTTSLLTVTTIQAQEGDGDRPANNFEKGIRPFLTKYCFDCHGPTKQKANLRLDILDGDLLNGNSSDTWQEVLDLVNLSEMPPKDATRLPNTQSRQAAIDLLTSEFRRVVELRRSTGGHNVLRRLTSYEYSNTLRDLLDLDLRFATALPPEGSAKEGFVNNSSVLGTSALHIEYFERIARINRNSHAPDEKPPSFVVRIEPERAYKRTPNIEKPKGSGSSYQLQPLVGGKPQNKGLFKLVSGELSPDSKAVLLAGNRPQDTITSPFSADRKIGGTLGDGRSGFQPEFIAEIYEIPHDSPVRITIRAAAVTGKGGTSPRLSFELGSFRGNGVSDQKEGGNIEVESEEFQTYEFIVHGANFPFQSNKPSRPSYFRIFNEFRRGTSDLSYEELPKLVIDWVEIESNYYPNWPASQKRAILLDSPNRDNESVYVREVLRDFMMRAYRRPVAEDEVERKAALFDKLRPTHATFEQTLVSTLTAVLCSANFLLIAEPAREPIADGGSSKQRHLNDYELASRLSYFLWSSMPDATLFALAEQGQLTDPSTLQSQVRRMLKDPKAMAFSKNFAAQWLDLVAIRQIAVNPEFFIFEETTKNLFEQESVLFLHHVLSSNLSIDNFIHSDFVVINHKLAKHYRIPGISGGFEVRELNPEHHRGGLLTQASMLFGNSTGSESHPILRGMWVLERLLDTPPPPPPPNVPDLPEPEGEDDTDLSLKERLIAHTTIQRCRDCHSRIDPWGVAFENYNALGQWREGAVDPNVRPPHQNIQVDPTTKLRDGHTIKNLDDLKQYILTEKKEQYRRALVRKTLSYALGRYLDFQDRPAVESICETLAANHDQFQLLLEQVVLSEPFLTK